MSDDFDPYQKWLGIPPQEQPPNYYRLLTLKPLETNLEVIDNTSAKLTAYLEARSNGKNAAHAARLLEEVAAARAFCSRPRERLPTIRRFKAASHLRHPMICRSSTALVIRSPLSAGKTSFKCIGRNAEPWKACRRESGDRRRNTRREWPQWPIAALAAPTVAARCHDRRRPVVRGRRDRSRDFNASGGRAGTAAEDYGGSIGAAARVWSPYGRSLEARCRGRGQSQDSARPGLYLSRRFAAKEISSSPL